MILILNFFFLGSILQPPAPKIPRTIENTREFDETLCLPDDEEVLSLALALIYDFCLFFVELVP